MPNSLKRNCLNGRVAIKKTHIWKGNKAKRLRFAQRHQNWCAEQWKVSCGVTSRDLKYLGQTDDSIQWRI